MKRIGPTSDHVPHGVLPRRVLLRSARAVRRARAEAARVVRDRVRVHDAARRRQPVPVAPAGRWSGATTAWWHSVALLLGLLATLVVGVIGFIEVRQPVPPAVAVHVRLHVLDRAAPGHDVRAPGVLHRVGVVPRVPREEHGRDAAAGVGGHRHAGQGPDRRRHITLLPGGPGVDHGHPAAGGEARHPDRSGARGGLDVASHHARA